MAKYADYKAELENHISDGEAARRHTELADAARKSSDVFQSTWKRLYTGLDYPDVANEFSKTSRRFQKHQRIVNATLNWLRNELHHGPQYREHYPSDAMYHDPIDSHMQKKHHAMDESHGFYALYIAWRPTTRIVVPDHRPQLLQAMALDDSFFRVVSPREFEELVAFVYECMGCRVQLTQQSRDFGADVLAWHAGPLDSETLIAVQVKRYAEHRKVGLKGIFELHGAVTHYQADTGHVVTSSDFSKPAREFAQQNRYHLVGAEKFQSELLRLFGEAVA